MKAKRLGKKDVNTKTTQRCVIKEETEVLDVKPLRCPPSSYFNKASQNYVLSSSSDPATSSMLHLSSLASSNASQQHQNLTKHSERVW